MRLSYRIPHHIVAGISLLAIAMLPQAAHAKNPFKSQPLTIKVSAPEVHAQTPLDIDEARRFCDTSTLQPIEGIWAYQQENLLVYIRKSANSRSVPPVYDITIIESDDARLLPGTKIGTLNESTDPSVFRMKLYSAWDMGFLTLPQEYLATYRPDHEALYMKGQKLKLSFNPMRLLPSIFKAFSINYDDPLDDLPKGMIKIYPSHDGNGSSLRTIRYL